MCAWLGHQPRFTTKFVAFSGAVHSYLLLGGTSVQLPYGLLEANDLLGASLLLVGTGGSMGGLPFLWTRHPFEQCGVKRIGIDRLCDMIVHPGLQAGGLVLYKCVGRHGQNG